MNKACCFAECLKEIMIERDISAVGLARIAAVSASRVYAYLDGSNLPSAANAVKIADALECSLDFLFGLSGDSARRIYAPAKYCAERVRDAVSSCALSRYAVSKLTGISQTQLYRICKCRQTPNMYALTALAECLRISLDYLTGRDAL